MLKLRYKRGWTTPMNQVDTLGRQFVDPGVFRQPMMVHKKCGDLLQDCILRLSLKSKRKHSDVLINLKAADLSREFLNCASDFRGIVSTVGRPLTAHWLSGPLLRSSPRWQLP
jgi:hypothetical protein